MTIDPADEPLGILFSDVARLFWRRLEGAWSAAGFDVGSAEVRVLMTIVERPGLRQAQLAESLHIEPMTLVGHLDRLVRRGLAERRPDPGDRRAKLVHPSERAADVLEELRAASAGVRAAQTDGFDAAEIATLRQLLQRVRTNLAAASRGEARA
jgi:DNA-binding MarR family transcriptional regulator